MKDLKAVSREVIIEWTEALDSQAIWWKEQVPHSVYIDLQLARFMSSKTSKQFSKRSPSRAVINVLHSSVVAQTVILVDESTLPAS